MDGKFFTFGPIAALLTFAAFFVASFFVGRPDPIE